MQTVDLKRPKPFAIPKSLVLDIVLFAFPVVCQTMMVTPYFGKNLTLCLNEIVVLGSVAIFVVLLGLSSIAGFGCLFGRIRKGAAKAVFVSVSALAFLISGVYSSHGVRRFAFERLADRSEIIVQAIKNYCSEKKKPPAKLTDLVPKLSSGDP